MDQEDINELKNVKEEKEIDEDGPSTGAGSENDKNFVPYPHIEPFRKIATLSMKYRPTLLTFHGTVKLDGSNCGITYDLKQKQIVATQSRNHVITPEHDVMGFSKFVCERNDAFIKIFEFILANYDITPDAPQEQSQENPEEAASIPKKFNYLTIFGEWCGGGIRGSGVAVAINQIKHKCFFIFDAYLCESTVSDEDHEGKSLRLKPSEFMENKPSGIYFIENYQTFDMDINFQNPNLEDVTKKLEELTAEVVNQDPVVFKEFGVKGKGEGIVWKSTTNFHNHRVLFKVKGSEFSASRTKRPAAAAPEKIEDPNIQKMVDYLITDIRLNQGIQVIFEDKLETKDYCKEDFKRMPKFVDWVIADCAREEDDTLQKNGFTIIDLKAKMTHKIRKYFSEFMFVALCTKK